MINTLIERRNTLKDNVQLDKKELASVVDDIKKLFFYDNDFQAAHTLEDIENKLTNAFTKLNIDLSVKDSFIYRTRQKRKLLLSVVLTERILLKRGIYQHLF